jgi:hypothetical protein
LVYLATLQKGGCSDMIGGALGTDEPGIVFEERSPYRCPKPKPWGIPTITPRPLGAPIARER